LTRVKYLWPKFKKQMRRRDNEQSLKDVLKQVVDLYRKDDKYRQAEVQIAWEEVIGTSIAKKTRSLYIRNKILTISLDSGVLKEELSFGREKIMKMMNENLGYHAVMKVEIK